MKRDFKGVWIPKEIYFRRDLKWIEKALITEIDSLDCENGCYAGDEYFAEFLQISRSRVSDILTKLRKLGVIKTVTINNKRYLKVC